MKKYPTLVSKLMSYGYVITFHSELLVQASYSYTTRCPIGIESVGHNGKAGNTNRSKKKASLNHGKLRGWKSNTLNDHIKLRI